jgi:hypothetical protein
MQKNKEIIHSILYAIAISTLFTASFMLSGIQFSQQALAIHEGNATTTQNQAVGGNTTTTDISAQNQAGLDGSTLASSDTTSQNQAAPAGNASETGTALTQTTTIQEPTINQNFVRQGTVASVPDPLPGHEGQHIAFIFPPREDGAVYSGVLTYTASKPVAVAVLHNYDPQNSTAIPEEYGTEFTSPLPGGGGNIAITLFQPPYEGDVNAASVPFTGNALALHTTDDGPFTATYTVNAFATQPENANAPLEFATVEGEIQEDAAGDQDQNTEGDQDQNTEGDQDQNTEGDQDQNTEGDQDQNTGP